ncbi:MAG: PQQ-binding-like beta-propeller repeat protein [Verrucomicrobiota bacterium]
MANPAADKLVRWLPVGILVTGGVILLFGLHANRHGLSERAPGADLVETTNGPAGIGKWEGKVVTGTGVASKLAGEWPRFRGLQGNGISPESTPLLKAWPAGGPKQLWKVDVGEGFAAAAVSKGRVYVMDYDRANQSDALRCLSLDDGAEIWRYTYPSKVKRNHGMSRTIPFVADQYLIALSPKCQVLCADPVRGELKWKMDLVREFNVEVPPWYAGQNPFVENNRLILGTGGDALLVAVDCLTGKVLWKSPNPNKWQMTHSSIATLEFAGRKQYVYCGSGGVAGVSADDGTILWEYLDWKISIANIATPVPVGDGRIFFCGGYNAGSAMIQLKEQAGKITVETLFRLKPAIFGSTQQTPILHKKHLFGVRPDGQLVCLDLNGKSVWESGPTRRFGSAPYLIAQDMIYVLDDDGTLTLVEAALDGYKELVRAKVLEGPDAWGPIALAGGRLIVRDNNKMACLDVGAK